MKNLIILIAFLCSSCSLWLNTGSDWEYDDLYTRSYVRPGYIYRDYWSPVNPYYQPNYFYSRPWTFYDRPNVIIIKPEVKPTTPGKRPTREGMSQTPSPYHNRGIQPQLNRRGKQ